MISKEESLFNLFSLRKAHWEKYDKTNYCRDGKKKSKKKKSVKLGQHVGRKCSWKFSIVHLWVEMMMYPSDTMWIIPLDYVPPSLDWHFFMAADISSIDIEVV